MPENLQKKTVHTISGTYHTLDIYADCFVFVDWACVYAVNDLA